MISRIVVDIVRAITLAGFFGIDLELRMRIGNIILVGCVLVLLVGLLV